MKRSILGALVVAVITTACASSATKSRGSEDTLRLGIFPNLTHAPGLVGIASGSFDKDMAPTKVETHSFNSGSDAANALLSGSLDATYIGPVPAATLYEQSGDVAIVSGAVQGGAALVVRKGSGITTAADLAGKKVAVPGIGNTQDIALRTWLHDNGLKAKDESGGGNVAVVEIDNTELPQVFRQGQVDAAWEPEPWPSLLESEGLATQLVNERTLWPHGSFPTTELLVNTTYMEAHPDVVKKLVQANFNSIQFIQQNTAKAKDLANQELQKLGSAAIPSQALDKAWSELTFSYDPLPNEAEANASNAYALGDLDQKPDNLSAMFKLDDLNAILKSKGLAQVSGTLSK